MNNVNTLTLVVPCFNEQDSVKIFYDEIFRIKTKIPETEIDILFIDDGSLDNTLGVIKGIAEMDNTVHYISFSRNFGKEAAIYAGIKNAKGDFVAVIDADLQDPPHLLPEMLQAVTEEGYDSVATRRVTREGEPPIRSFFARLFYRLMNKISKTDIVDGARDYRLMNRKFVNAVLKLGEYNRFSKGLFGWVGFKTKWIEFKNSQRSVGETKWSFWKLFKYSIEGIVAFSTAPLVVSSLAGIIACLVSLLSTIFIIVRKLIFGDPVMGWASTISVILFIGGIQLMCIGILGQYLAKAYLETKKRPIYIIDQSDVESE